jgi:ubiquinone/menaquinone biosynthesis C-methylase UbiE
MPAAEERREAGPRYRGAKMTQTHAQFLGSIPEHYDRHLGPVIFEPYAADLAVRVSTSGAESVLEIACGTGILTQQLRARLPRAARLVATDLNEPMIDHARSKLGSLEAIEWRQADAAALSFESGAFQALACQFGFMFVPDKDAAFREARRVLERVRPHRARDDRKLLRRGSAELLRGAVRIPRRRRDSRPAGRE